MLLLPFFPTVCNRDLLHLLHQSIERELVGMPTRSTRETCFDQSGFLENPQLALNLSLRDPKALC